MIGKKKSKLLVFIMMLGILWLKQNVYAGQMDNVIQFNDHCYKLFTEKKNWISAQEFCRSLGGHLVTISSEAENNFVTSILDGSAAMIGLSDAETEGTMVWVTNEAVVYTNFSSGEPNNERNEDYCLIFTNGKWNDGHLEREKWNFVCEWDSKIPQKKNTYTITYDYKGGTKIGEKDNPESYNSNQTIILAAPGKTGYIFIGWYADSKLTKKISRIKKGTTGNLKLYAKWKPIVYHITYNKNGATDGSMTKDMNVAYDKKIKLKSNKFKRTGYSFAGWSTTKKGKVQYKNNQEVSNLSYKNNETVNLYAKWNLKHYTIKYVSIPENLNVDWKTNKIDYTVEDAFSLSKPECEGYIFKGWYIDKAGKKAANTSIEKGSTEEKVFYAKFTPIKYTIEFNGNNVINDVPAKLKCVYGKNYTLPGSSVEGFDGWNTAADGSGVAYQAGQSVKNLINENGSTIILYAQLRMKNKIEHIHFAGRDFILDASKADPYNYTDSNEIAKKLIDIFRGNTGITTVNNSPVNVALGTSNVPDNNIILFACGRQNNGTSCWIYAHSVYYSLFGEAIGGGSGPYSNSYLVGGAKGVTEANYDIFNRLGVKHTVGAYLRTTTHSMIVLGYNKTGIAILEGNANGKGLVRISNYSWNIFNSAILKNGARPINFIIQPKQF